ncbi:hypothetical protein [Planosporangium mesophilum]|uniref:hypothetical protein n=1 Tax=Planosporangium mesophilum TaxID=689768 RepID=UPI00143B148E|nr:hypothetical protein [Planosporangium mesophilum]NJC86065.1 hypothetical protein [Planosporangium mesophilum]
MSTSLSSVIAATAQWLVRAYPGPGGTFSATLAEVQARQATTVAAWLRYPTALDAALVDMLGPGGSDRLDWLAGAEGQHPSEEHAWRTWVDEVVASWAACLLADPELATAAVAAVANSEHMIGLYCDFLRLTTPDDRDRYAAILLRHPDLTGPVADLHRTQLLELLDNGAAEAA